MIVFVRLTAATINSLKEKLGQTQPGKDMVKGGPMKVKRL